MADFRETLFAIGLFVFCILLLIYWNTRKPKNYPPGPKWYPVVGSALEIRKIRRKHGLFCKAVSELNDIYNGNGVVGAKLGKDKLVIAFSCDVIKELMSNEDFDGRPTGPFYETRTWGSRKGIIMTDEDFWQEQRRFLVRHLKDFGFARRGMVDLVQNEAEHLLIDLQNAVKKGALIPMHNLFNVYVLNTLWSMMAGIRYDRDHEELLELQSLVDELFKNIDMVGCLFSHFPFLRYIAPAFSGYSKFLAIHSHIYEFIEREIENHKKVFHPNNEPRDLMDSYLQALSVPNQKLSFSEKQLMAICLDMFLAGSETTTKSLGFAFLYIVRDEIVQRKIQDELDAVIGRGRLPTWEDRVNLPYCEAVAHETLRIFMSYSFSLPHRALRNTRLKGYNIPKDTMVIGCFTGIFMDEKNFKEPEKFQPERFIQCGKLNVPDTYVPFGAGRRRCMGENMAKQNLFLFITTLLQNFSFRVPENHPLPDIVPQEGVTPCVKPFTAYVIPR